MPANDVFEVSVDAVLNGQNMTNVMHFIQIGADGTGDARTAMAGLWTAIFDLPLRNTQSSSVLHQQTRVRRVLPTQTQTTITAGVNAGTRLVESIPTNQTAILRFYANPFGRRGTGNQRFYGVGTDVVLSGRISDGMATLMQLYGVLFITNAPPSNSYVFRAAILSNDGIARPIMKTLPLPVVKTMHSRTVGVGI